MNKRRPDSRLAFDDPHYCKRCGYELPEPCFEHDTHPLGGGEPPEYCGRCLAKVVLEGGE